MIARAEGWEDIEDVTVEQSHGRIETREYHVLPSSELEHQFPDWKGLNNIGVAIGYRIDKSGKEALEHRYYISSAELEKERFASAVRGHREIELVSYINTSSFPTIAIDKEAQDIPKYTGFISL